MSGNKEEADKFVASFREFVTKEALSLNQIFNCDETGLNYRLLPEVTLAASFEKSAIGRMRSKDCVTLNLC